jgi:hypothetical protein
MKHPFLRTHALNAKSFSYVAQCTHIEKAMDEKDMRARGDGVTAVGCFVDGSEGIEGEGRG